MAYTIITASYGNEDNTSAVINTEEVGHAAINPINYPEEWANLLAWEAKGNRIRPLVESTGYKTMIAEKQRRQQLKPIAAQKLASFGLTVEELKVLLNG